VAPDNVGALAEAIANLSADEALRRRMGAAGRERVVAGYTERHAGDAAARAWRAVLR
jgi:glycosyltransferase involved in cell wall biosynthesis